jgi:hypothetical protein
MTGLTPTPSAAGCVSLVAEVMSGRSATVTVFKGGRMRRWVYGIALPITLLVTAATGGSLVGQAAQTSTSPDVLTSLLIEVRGLRAAMETMASAGPRVHLALGRLQLQEQRVTNQIRRLDLVRSSLVVAQGELEPLAQRVKDETESVNQAPDADTRHGREGQLKAAKAEWSRKNAEVQRLSAEEATLVQEIGIENNRWAEFNQRLEELERTLGRR